MTFDNFLEELKESKLSFEINHIGFLRTDDGQAQCPVCALCKIKTQQFFPNIAWVSAAQFLELDIEDAREIVKMADRPTDKTSAPLLEAVNLTP